MTRSIARLLCDRASCLKFLSPVHHTGNKVEFNAVAETGNKSTTKSTVADTVDFVPSLYTGAKATRSTLSTFNKIDRVEFDSVPTIGSTNGQPVSLQYFTAPRWAPIFTDPFRAADFTVPSPSPASVSLITSFFPRLDSLLGGISLPHPRLPVRLLVRYR